MKRKFGWIGLLALILLCLCACSDKEQEQTSETALTESAYLAEANRTNYSSGKKVIPLFYTNNQSISLYETEKTYDFLGMDRTTILNEIMSDLENVDNIDKKELEDLTVQSIIPPGVIDSIKQRKEMTEEKPENAEKPERNVIEIHMNQLYYDMKLNERVVLRAGLSRTLFASGIADRIEFYAPDLSKEEGTMVLVSTSSAEDKLIINQYSRDFYTDEVWVTLYFGSADGSCLKTETKTLTLGMTDPLPTAIVKALIAGPTESGMKSVIPQGTMIEDVFIKDGVCYVDLSEEFQKNHLGGEQEEKLTIYSIVNSLQDVSGIRYVQFLIEGKKVEYYKSYVKIDTFLTSDMDLVEP